jgi:hypothetical protein
MGGGQGKSLDQIHQGSGDDLLCAFIAKGRDIGAPMRRDWTVGWFILLSVVFWSNNFTDKLVLAQDSPDGWMIGTVFDPKTKLSAIGISRPGATPKIFFTVLPVEAKLLSWHLPWEEASSRVQIPPQWRSATPEFITSN